MRTRRLSLLALFAIAGCAPHDPNRLCRSRELEGSSLPPTVRLTVEEFPNKPLMLGQTITITAISSHYDRSGECTLDPRQLTYQWHFSPPAAVPESLTTDAHGSRISFKLTSVSLSTISVDATHPQLGTESGRTDPLPIYTPQQAAIVVLMNDLDRLYGYNTLTATEPMPDQLQRLQFRLSQAMNAIYGDDPQSAVEQLEAFRNEIRTMRTIDEAWAPVLTRTDVILEEIRALEHVKKE